MAINKDLRLFKERMNKINTDPYEFNYKTLIIKEDESILCKNAMLYKEKAGERIKLYINSAKKNLEVSKKGN